MNLLIPAFVLALLALVAGPAAAQKPVPGLWEHSITMKSQSGRMEAGIARMQEQLAAMPPEQRKQMEEMMARQGMTAPPPAGAKPGGGAPVAMKVCLTPEQAARDELPKAEGNCKQTSQQRSGNTLRFKYACTGEVQTSGEGEYTFESSKAYRGRITTETSMRGQPERMEMTMTGRWLAADCGSVKPRP